MFHWIDWVMSVVLHWAGNFWILPTLSLFCFIDGFAPILPSETLIIALASLSHTGSVVPLHWVVFFAFVGAFAGDLGAYHIGKLLPVHKIPLIRRFATPEALNVARKALNRRGTSYLLAARFIPVGRVAVNMTAGAAGYKLRRFVPTMIVADLLWTSLSVVIGLTAGQFFQKNPLLGMVLGIAAGITIGLIIDRIIGYFYQGKETDEDEVEEIVTEFEKAEEAETLIEMNQK
ncbi:DedA family protein [Actinomycetaceae bacterium TAE3-ERU4]|nr:DedA family protein [Actinomycetaceae bacterium TAE3-ERU4]